MRNPQLLLQLSLVNLAYSPCATKLPRLASATTSKGFFPPRTLALVYRIFKHEQACFEAKQHKTADTNWYARLVEELEEMKQTKLLNLANIPDQERRAETAHGCKHKEAARAL